MSSAKTTKAEKIPLTEKETAFNNKFNREIVDVLTAVSMTIKKSYKERLFEDVKDGKAVYGLQSANKTQVSFLATQIDAAAAEARSYLIPEASVKGKGGYAAYHYMDKSIAPMMGFREGTPLWPTGGYPLIAIGCLTSWTALYFFLNNRQNPEKGKEKLFSCDEYIRQYLGMYDGASAGTRENGTPYDPFNLNEIDFPRLQKIFKKFIIRDAEGNTPVVEIPKGSPLETAINELQDVYENLNKQKVALKAKKVTIKDTQKDFAKTEIDFKAGRIPESIYKKSAGLVAKAEQDYADAAKKFVEDCGNAGIPKQVYA